MLLMSLVCGPSCNCSMLGTVLFYTRGHCIVFSSQLLWKGGFVAVAIVYIACFLLQCMYANKLSVHLTIRYFFVRKISLVIFGFCKIKDTFGLVSCRDSYLFGWVYEYCPWANRRILKWTSEWT